MRICFLFCLLASVRAFTALQTETTTRRKAIVAQRSAANSRRRRFAGPHFPSFSLSSSAISDDANVGLSRDTKSAGHYRGVERVQKFARLPVWPVVNGVLIWIVGKVLGDQVAARLEDQITGRVCPNFFEYSETRPFVMLVHHCHSFAAFDIVRFIQRTFFPEGFPAHPHRGFITVTYILDGGFVHRDSEGVRQRYGGSQAAMGQQGKHTQWLNTGSGMLHEEMFDNNDSSIPFWQPVRQELYQLWLNVPAKDKWTEPSSVLLGGPDETPLVEAKDKSHRTLVLAGSFDGSSAAAPVVSDVSIFHVQVSKGGRWVYHVPPQYETVLIYVRKGSGLQCVTKNEHASDDESTSSIPVHHIAYMEAAGDLVLQNSESDMADFLLLAGEPIREPCFASGSMVMNNAREIDQAYRDYQMGQFGVPWDHNMSDAEWREHVAATSPRRGGIAAGTSKNSLE